MKIGLIGAGRAGGALALALRSAGYGFAGVADLDLERARRLGGTLGAPVLTGAELAADADTIVLAVPDGAIAGAAAELAEGLSVTGRVFLHLSGAHPSSILRPLGPHGALGSLHPLLSLAGVPDDPERLRECYYCFEGEEAAEAAARRIVSDLGGRVLAIATDGKALYHAAASIAANYLVSLVDVAMGLLGRLGIARDEARAALHPLLSGVIANLGTVDPETALTGPISRGDLGTIRAHLGALERADPRTLDVYQAMGRAAITLAERAGRLSRERAGEIEALLAGEACTYGRQ